MNSEQHQQAKHLYFQTNLSKTQIAEALHISRRSLHYWIKEGNWARLKRSAEHLPSLLAENCYHIIAHFSEHLLSETRMKQPITYQEADTLHKLALTVNKLKNRSTLNENMETFAFFMDKLGKKSPALAKELVPHVDEYIYSRASIYASHVMPEKFNDLGYIPAEEPDTKEEQLDLDDIFAWSEDQQSARHCEEQSPAPCDAATKQPHETPPPPAGHCGEQSPAPCGAATKQPHVTSPSPLGEGRGEASPSFIFNPDHTPEEHLLANGLKPIPKLPPLDTIEQFREYQRSLAMEDEPHTVPKAA